VQALVLPVEEREEATAACDRALGCLQRELGFQAARLNTNCKVSAL